MFNIANILERFNQFAYSYEKGESEENIRALELKRKHSFRVFRNARFIVQKENVSDIQKELAEVIAILHDVGRFEQFKRTGKYIDTSEVNHGTIGANMLAGGLLEYFIPEIRTFDSIIITAVRLHNVLELPNDLDETERFQCEVVRDADKIDIFYLCTLEEETNILYARSKEPETYMLNPNIVLELKRRKTVDLKLVRNSIDLFALRIGFLNQFNFQRTLEYIDENHYIDKMFDVFQKKTEGYSQNDIEWLRQYASEVMNS